MTTMDVDAVKIASLGPGVLLEHEDTAHLVSKVFVVDDLLVAFSLDEDERPQAWRFSSFSEQDGGFVFEVEGVLRLGVYNRRDKRLKVNWDQEAADAFVKEAEAA